MAVSPRSLANLRPGPAWTPGTAPNPMGAAHTIARLKRTARAKWTAAAFDELGSIMSDKQCSAQDRIRAAELLLHYALGRPARVRRSWPRAPWLSKRVAHQRSVLERPPPLQIGPPARVAGIPDHQGHSRSRVRRLTGPWDERLMAVPVSGGCGMAGRPDSRIYEEEAAEG
jgi:hypothetical protein